MMANKFDDNMRGVLFRAKEKRAESSPDYTGNVTINGVEYALSGWKKVSRNNEPYLSIAAKVKENNAPRTGNGPANTNREPPRQDFSDDVPF